MDLPRRRPITILDRSGTRVPSALLRKAIEAVLADYGVKGSVSLLLTDDEQVRTLNRRFRKVDEATDVLTFPGDSDHAGDIAISVPFAQRQADVRGIPINRELLYLSLHGALHLAGLDDIKPKERDRMVREMNRFASLLGQPEDTSWSSLHEEAKA